MKQLFFTILIFCCTLATVCSCSSEDPSSQPRQDIPLSRAEVEFVSADNEFSLNFFKKAIEDNQSNVCVSPLSLSMALSMTANGAKGETQKEILEVLGFDGQNMDAVNTFNSRIVKDLYAVDRSTGISLANSIWIDNSADVKESFISGNRQKYGADIFQEKLAATSTMDKINSWCKDKTNGMIPNFITQPLSEHSIIALINAMYFNGTWATPFDKSLIAKGNFYNNGVTPVETDMMEGEFLCFAAHDTNGANWVSLPYGNGAYEMLIVLPDNIGEGCVGEYLSKISKDDFEYIYSNLVATNMKLRMPKFDFESMIEPDEILNNLGIVKMFDGSGDFSGIADRRLVFTSLQKTKISVDESGTKAASVSMVKDFDLLPSYADGNITVDHPFAFFICERSTGVILFTGCVNTF